MPTQPEYTFETENSHGRLTLRGDWTVHTLARVQADLAGEAVADLSRLDVDASDAGRIDTAGAFVIDRFAQRAGADEVTLSGGDDKMNALLEQAKTLRPEPEHDVIPPRPHGVVDLLERPLKRPFTHASPQAGTPCCSRNRP